VAAPLLKTQRAVTGGTRSDLLADVTRIEIDIELIDNSGGTDIEAIDNIELVSHPAGLV
jgi:hypothetical protein